MAYHKNDIYDKAYTELYLAGLSLQEIASRVNRTRQSVFKAFSLRGFKLRSPNARPFKVYDSKKFTLRNNGYYSLTTGERTLMHRYIWEKERGPIPDGWDIHHIDEDKTNNCIENFECLPKSEHTRKYASGHNQFTHPRNK